MCFWCNFPKAHYTDGVRNLYELMHEHEDRGSVDALFNAAQALDHWAYAVSQDPSDVNVFNLLEARAYADDVHKRLTGKPLPLQ